ncbi:RING/U-box superfamily protein [Thalictrum thalictroides]|uniref:RING/U-box superfamily protein n=1 Tax=Thalictrum thalictroides TaxID=46969 RepID=A0A7J6VLL6_THATH|nr:RING/U-box superfamily protein [Thalictrum thalictroides]
MGLSHYPSAAEGVLPLLVMNTVISVAILKGMVRWVLQVMGCVKNQSDFDEEIIDEEYPESLGRRREISITLFKSLCHSKASGAKSDQGNCTSHLCPMECCVCLHRFEADEEVSELSCKHFFHKGCLEKWLNHKHSTCPLCRSTF